MKQILLFSVFLLSFCVKAQTNEFFSGNEITSNHSWQGDVDRFTINPSGEIEFTSPTGIAGNASIHTPVIYSENMAWELDVKLDFKPTNANNCRIYIYSTEDLSIYIQAGNNTGQVSLYVQEGFRSPKLCISGRKILSNEPYPLVSIRLTLEDNKLWSLYSKMESENVYHEEGTYSYHFDNTDETNNFTIKCRYIKGRISTFYFDNIQIIGSKTESEISTVDLLDVDLIESDKLQFTFDNPVDISEAIFTITDMEGTTDISYGTNQSIVIVSLPENLKEEYEYIVHWDNLYDLKGKPILDLSVEVFWEKDDDDDKKEEESPPTPYETGQIIFNEVMADPKGAVGLPETEYIELYNTSDIDISLKNWVINYDNTEVLLEEFTLPSKSYIVLYKANREILIDEGGYSMPLAKFPAALANTGKYLSLKDATGKLIDEFKYPKAVAGVSLEYSSSGWHLSTDDRGGTPGSINSTNEIPLFSSVESGDIVFNELLPNPFPGGSEYIELYNRSENQLSLYGLAIAIRKSDGTFNTHYSLSGIQNPMEKGSYALLTRNIEGVADNYLITSPEVLHEIKLPVLANTISTLVLFREHDKVIIDEVSYSSKWHDSSIKNQKGVALERINPDEKTQDYLNWTSASSTAGYGTPGYQNSQFRNNSGEDNKTGISIPVLSDNGMFIITYYLNIPGYNCRAYIFNMAGQRVAQIMNHELIGTSGEFMWDGKGFDGKRLKTGIYIFSVELYHTSGITKHYKKVFPVR